MQSKKESSEMAKAERRSGYTDSEGRSRGGLHNPEIRRLVRDGKMSPSAELAPTSTRKTRIAEDDNYYRRRDYAFFESLVYYFNEDWFDTRDDWNENISIGFSRYKSSSKPLKCPKCDRKWSRANDGSTEKFYYLDRQLFSGIPTGTGTCPDCE